MCNQDKLPLFEAIKKYADAKYLRMHMPGHKGLSFPDFFSEFIGDKLYELDVTELPGTDDLHVPTGAIAQAEKLAAKLFGAQATIFLINGATQGINALMMLDSGKKFIIPRHGHKAMYHGLILSGAEPIYIKPKYLPEWGIATGSDEGHYQSLVAANPDAAQVWLTSPTYFGQLENTKLFKEHLPQQAKLFVDEAHGSHLRFMGNGVSAIQQGADAAVQSWHKTLGAFTQSAVVHFASSALALEARKTIALTETTSPSYLLLLSLDSARRQMALYGEEILAKTREVSIYLRECLQCIKGLSLMPVDDETKIAIKLTGYTGQQLFTILADHGIMPELAQGNFVLLHSTLSLRRQDADRILKVFKDLKTNYQKNVCELPLPTMPEVVISPREAFYADKSSIPFVEILGKVSGEFVIPYPPGIPALVPGEMITEDTQEYLSYLRKNKIKIHGPRDLELNTLAIIDY